MANQEKLTALRCIDLLKETERDGPVFALWQTIRLRDAIRAHLRALINPRKRKAKRRG
jgi:hypothetical protein